MPHTCHDLCSNIWSPTSKKKHIPTGHPKECDFQQPLPPMAGGLSEPESSPFNCFTLQSGKLTAHQSDPKRIGMDRGTLPETNIAH